MKIAETILEFKESTKESQGDIFRKVMVSVAHGEDIGRISWKENISLKVLKGVNLFGDLTQVFFKVLHMRFLKFYVRALFLECYVRFFLEVP